MNSDWNEPPESRSFGGGGGGPAFAMPGMTPIIKMLMVANGAIFLLGFAVSLVAPQAWASIEAVLGVSPTLWKSWFPFVPVWQPLTYGFLHSISSPFHILMNMLFLFFLGTMLEGIIGSRRFLVTYLAGIVLAGIASLLVGLLMGDGAHTIGASGGVLAIVVAVATLRPNTRIIFIIIPMTLKVFALIYVGLDLFNALNVVFRHQSTGVAHFAHLAGAAFGYAAVRTGWIWRDPLAELEAKREKRSQHLRVEEDMKVDDLLQRIHRDGIQSLSEREKAFLKRVSKRR